VLAGRRLWTDIDGNSFEAAVVWVNQDQEVKLKGSDGEIIFRPFASFVASDHEHLEQLLFRKIHGEPHPVLPQKMNELFGSEIWADQYLWDDDTGSVAKRMRLCLESKTDFMENHRAYPLGKEKILGEPVYTTVLYGDDSLAESLYFVFLNQGDIPLSDRIDEEFVENMTRQIEKSGMNVHDAILPLLGEPERDTIGKGLMREKVCRWDWNGHAIVLSMQEGKYATLHILSTDRADRGGRVAKIKSSDLRRRMASCVERRDNGDVIIQNIPMIDQGPKGYCSPATWERYLRYLGIPADMYQLANVGNTDIGGGTYLGEMIDATEGLLSANGRSVREVNDFMEIDTVAEYIDLGMPLMWSFRSSSDFQRAATTNTARRNGEEIDVKEKPNSSEGYGGHICLITGYNAKTDVIAISDSWGAEFKERWVPLRLMTRNSLYGRMTIIKW